MNINIIATGKLKEKYLLEAQEYFLGSIAKRKNILINLFELNDMSMSDNPSDSESLKIKNLEGFQVIKLLEKENLIKESYIVLLDLEGIRVNEKSFKAIIEKAENKYKNSITFIIGGSLGNSDDLKSICTYTIKLSDMTYPHQLFRIALLELIDLYL